MIIKNWKRIVQIACVAVLVVSLVASGFVHIGARKNNEALSLELSNNKTMLANAQDELTIATNELKTTKENLQAETEKTAGLNDELAKLQTEFENINEELEVANTTINDLKDTEYELVYLGNYKITYYCDERYPHICGGNGVTASGKKTNVGVTAAADWSVLPKGSKVYISGIGWRTIQDVGGSVKGKHIDVLVGTHSEALQCGTDNEGVWLLVKRK